MNQTESKFFMDSSAWISYFLADNEKVKEIIEEANLILTSVISIFEIKRKLLKEGYDRESVERVISFIISRSMLIEISREIAELAAEISIKHKLHSTDSLIYTSSKIEKSILITSDSDFKGIENVKMIN